jgi:hypothetical protein
MSLREQTFAGLRTIGRSAGPGEHGRPGRVHRRLADESVQTQAAREARAATREGARAPRDRRDSDTRSLKACGHRYNSPLLTAASLHPSLRAQSKA